MSDIKIVVLATGGTIAGVADSADAVLGYRAGERGVAELLAAAGEAARGGLAVVGEQVAQIDSKDMSFALWLQLARRVAYWLAQAEVQGVVVTHGTDTLEETAYFLQAVLQPAKPVVLTCAMRPATARLADGPQNLADAIGVAATPGASGVVVVCAGVVHAADAVQKLHGWRLDAFSSGDGGPLGFVEAGQLRLARNWPTASVESIDIAIENIAKWSEWPRVEIVMSHAGARGDTVRALVRDGVQGLVVAGTGNGTVHQDLEAALREAQAAGVRVLRSTRCALGRVLPVPGAVLPDAGGLSPVKARIALMLALMA
ncbi:MAG TPA: asparaginase [Burkholderiaceae bacterium]